MSSTGLIELRNNEFSPFADMQTTPGLTFRQNPPTERICRTEYRRLTIWKDPAGR